MKTKTFTLSLAFLASLSLLAACAPRVQPPAQQQSTQQQSSSSATTNSSQPQASAGQNVPVAQPTNIDGTYKGQDEGDSVTLVITGTTGTWTKVELDGDQEIKQVSLDPANQRMIVGDDVKIYSVNGNQITIDDMDRDPSDQVVLTK